MIGRISGLGLAFALCLAVNTPSVAAPGKSATQAGDRMAALSPLVGEWRGSGWMLLPDGTRQSFTSHEQVSERLSGNALLVEGQHRAGDGQLVHDAMAMITWDRAQNGYRMRTALASGMGGDFPLEIGPGSFRWTMELPGGQIEYTAEFNKDSWVERGRRIGADGQSIDFFEMQLQREQ